MAYPIAISFQSESALSLNYVPVHLYENPSSLGPPNTTIPPDRSHMDFRTNPIDFASTPADPVIWKIICVFIASIIIILQPDARGKYDF